MKGEPMMDERKLEMECVRRGKTFKQKVADRHAVTGATQLADASVTTGVPVYERNAFLTRPRRAQRRDPAGLRLGPEKL